jgi:hypothetical protein
MDATDEYAGAESIVTLPEGAEQFLQLKVAIRCALGRSPPSPKTANFIPFLFHSPGNSYSTTPNVGGCRMDREGKIELTFWRSWR